LGEGNAELGTRREARRRKVVMAAILMGIGEEQKVGIGTRIGPYLKDDGFL